jgi:hypothetical protein
LNERIAALERELQQLREQQRLELVVTIASIVGSGCCFSARELFAHARVSPELAAAFADAGVDSGRVLGKLLRTLCGRGLERIGADEHGAIWTCS